MERIDECAETRGPVSTAAANESVEDAALRLSKFDTERFRHLVLRSLQGARLGVADEHDLTQVVLIAAVRQARRGSVPRREAGNDLWRWLRVVARRSAKKLRAREHRLRRAYPDAALRRTSSDAEPADHLISRREHEESLLRCLGNDTLRAVACAKLDGETNAEIAARLGVHTRTVERHVRRIRQLLRREKDVEKE
jgi:RNA polymerase sigma factor (sigma-70 family)